MIHNTIIKIWLKISGFDKNFYLGSYKDVADSLLDPYYHYFYYGSREGRFKNAKSFKNGLRLQVFESHYPVLIQDKYLSDFYINLPTKFQKNDIHIISYVILNKLNLESPINIISVNELSLLDRLRVNFKFFLKKQKIYLFHHDGNFYLTKNIFFTNSCKSIIFHNVHEMRRFFILLDYFTKIQFIGFTDVNVSNIIGDS